MTTNVSPVTENEMRNFADRMVTMVVSHSQQAHDLSDLRSRFDSLEGQVKSLISDNESQRSQIETLVAERDKARADANDALNMYEAEEKAHHATKGSLADTQNKLNWSQNDLVSARSNNLDLTTKLEAAQKDNANLISERNRLKNDLEVNRSTIDRAWSVVRSKNLEIERLLTKLEKFKSILDDKDDYKDEPSKPETQGQDWSKATD